jgi:SAM-dependent methyltransferase
MELPLATHKVEEFEEKMEFLAPFMHTLKFQDSIYVGEIPERIGGFGDKKTFVNRRSNPADIDTFRVAYSCLKEGSHRKFFEKIIATLPFSAVERSNLRVLDIASATGKFSYYCIDCGFGRVLSTEIRPNQVAQERLILECIEDRKYQERIEVIHDPISADHPDYPERYMDMHIDVALSFGLMYHLANPLQHLMNLRKIARQYAVIYTQVCAPDLPSNTWLLREENPDQITKGIDGVSWRPHFLELVRISQKLGFEVVDIVYPDEFVKNFPEYKNFTEYHRTKLRLANLFQTILRQLHVFRFIPFRIGMQKNLDYEYYKYLGLHPFYMALVLRVNSHE